MGVSAVKEWSSGVSDHAWANQRLTSAVVAAASARHSQAYYIRVHQGSEGRACRIRFEGSTETGGSITPFARSQSVAANRVAGFFDAQM